MSLDKLAEKIVAAADSEADSIISAAQEEAKSIKAVAKKEAAAIVEQLKQEAEKEAAQLGTEMSAAARQHNQKHILIAKREELDATWQAILDMVGSASMKGRGKLLKSLLAEASIQGDKSMVLRPVTLDRKALKDLDSKFKFGDEIDGLGGFLLEADGGAVSLDFRFESRLQDAWNDNLASVTETLFS